MAILSSMNRPGELENLYALMGMATAYAGAHGFGSKKIAEIELALEEILVNIIKHAYMEQGIKGEIAVNCRLDGPKKLIIEIVDWGMPFDILSVPKPDIAADIDVRQIGGLGIYFAKKLMDEIRYRREDGRNIITLALSNTPSATDDP